MGIYNAWSEDELCYLRDNAKRTSYREIGLVLGRPEGGVRSFAFKNRIDGKHLVKEIDHDFFSVQTDLTCYWAGFISADGYIAHDRNKVVLAVADKDSEHLDSLRQKIGSTLSIHKFSKISMLNKKEHLGYNAAMHIVSEKWLNDLNSIFNISGLKRDRKTAPTITQESHILSYLVGLIDGDGSIWTNQSRVKGKIYPRTVINFLGSKELLEWVSTFVLENTSSKHQTRKPNIINKHANCYEHRIYGNRADMLLTKLFTVDVPRLERKWESYRNTHGGSYEQ